MISFLMYSSPIVTAGRNRYQQGTYVELMGKIYYIPSQLGPGLYPEFINNNLHCKLNMPLWLLFQINTGNIIAEDISEIFKISPTYTR